MNKKVIAAIVAVVLIAGGTYWWMQSNGSKTSTDTKTTASSNESATNKEDTATKTAAVVNDACGVFTLDELRTGMNITDLAAGSSDGYKTVYNSDNLPTVQCDWEQGSSAPEDYTIHLDVYNFATTDKAKTDLNDSNVNAGSLTTEVVNGVADGALFARSGSGTPKQAAIYWRKGTVTYHLAAVRLAGVDRPAVEAQLKNIVSKKFS